MSKIKSLFAREIIDSRGVPTVEVEIELISQHSIIASVPSGASTGTFEAYELRDGDKNRYFSKGVQKAVSLINSEIKETILGFDVMNQKEIDNIQGRENIWFCGAYLGYGFHEDGISSSMNVARRIHDFEKEKFNEL